MQADAVRGEIAFDHVDLEIDGHKILRDLISFHVDAGKTLGIMGMTGSGKSSVINLLERFYDAAAGRVMIDGKGCQNHAAGGYPQKHRGGHAGCVSRFRIRFRKTSVWGRGRFLEYETVCQAAGRSARAHDFIQPG